MMSVRLTMEGHIYKIREISDNLFLLRKGFSDDYPEAEGALGFLADTLREEADSLLTILFDKEGLSDQTCCRSSNNR